MRAADAPPLEAMTTTNATTSKLNELATRSVGRLLWVYSLPAVVGMLVMQLYNVVDRAFIGHVVGKEAIAGLTITFPVMNITTALGVLIGAGAAARVSILLGNGNPGAARRVLGNALTLTILIGAAYLSVFALCIDDILRLFGATPVSLPYAREFMIWILPGLFMMNLTYSFNNIMRASGFPTKAMVTMLIGAGLNIVLAPLFIYVLGWGIKGAAIGSDISMAVTTFFVMHHFVSTPGEVHYTRGIYRLRAGVIWSIIGIGAAPAIVNVASCLINIFINKNLIDRGGDDAVASAGVFVTFTSLIVCVIIGICQGMQPVVGYNYGAGLFHRLKRAYLLAVGASTAVCCVGFGVGMLWPESVAAVFNSDPDFVAHTGRSLTMAMTAFWMVGYQIVSTNFLQSIGRVGFSIVLSLSRQVIFLLPILYLMVRRMGLDGIWYSFPISDVCATVVTTLLIVIEFRRLRRLAGAQEREPRLTPRDT